MEDLSEWRDPKKKEAANCDGGPEGNIPPVYPCCKQNANDAVISNAGGQMTLPQSRG